MIHGTHIVYLFEQLFVHDTGVRYPSIGTSCYFMGNIMCALQYSLRSALSGRFGMQCVISCLTKL
jgi:hypothetical protein